MSRSMAIGSLFGVVLTAALAYYIATSDVIKKAPKTAAQSIEMIGAIDTAEVDSPPPTLIGYSLDFPGSKDFIAHRAELKPKISGDAWDQVFKAAKMPSSVRLTDDCRTVESEKSISVPPQYAEAITAGEINVHFVGSRIPRCFATGTKLTVLVDDLAGGTSMYNILGQATLNRVVALAIVKIPPLFLVEIGTNLRDLAYLSNLSQSPRQSAGEVFILNFSFSPQQPLIDESKIPPFFPGAITVKPGALKSYFNNFSTTEKPVLIDARDRRNVSSGENFPGAIKVPFISSNPLQLRFQLNLPLSVGIGAKFDLRLLPANRNTPLVIFGNDESDAAPLWTIRYLRLLNYRSIFLVDGGMKALNGVNPPVSF